MKMRLVTDPAELEVERWRELQEACGQCQPMMGPEWMLTWWRHYGSGRRLAVGVFEENGRWQGLAPMMSRAFTYRPGLTFRRIEAIGAASEEADAVCSEYLTILAREPAVVDSFVQHLVAGDFGPWDEWVLSPVDAESPVVEPLREALLRHGLELESTPTGESPYVALPATWEAYLAQLNKKKRKSLRRAMDDFDEWSGGTARVVRVESREQLEEGRLVLRALHEERWHDAGQSGVFASSRFDAFHRDIMERLLARNEVDLTWLEVHGEPMAVHYSFVCAGKIYFYQAGRKVDVPGRIRLGVVLLQMRLRDAIARGIREFDFLGGPAQYKSLFTRTARGLVTLRVCRPTWKETLRKTLRWGYRTLRHLVQPNIERPLTFGSKGVNLPPRG